MQPATTPLWCRRRCNGRNPVRGTAFAREEERLIQGNETMSIKPILTAVALTLALSSGPVLAAEAGATVSGAANAAGSATTGAGGADAGANAGADAAANASTDGTASASVTASGNLGVNISGAGTTAESQTAFFSTLSAADQATITGKCKDATAMKSFTAEETAFCQATVK